MRIVFMGTPEFAVPSLKYLIENHEVVGVFTQPDRPKGRGKKMAPPPIKEFAMKNDIPVYQPEKIKTKESMAILEQLAPEIIIVIAYGQIVNQQILNLPPHGCINVHASLLPKLRGASPINMAIVRGFQKTGVTTMKMDIGLDTGDILLSKSIDIKPMMIAGELHDVLMELSADVLKETLDTLDDIIPVKQIDSESTYAPIIDKAMASIDWNQPAVEIVNLIRGFNPWPVAYTELNDQRMKIFKAIIINERKSELPGTVIALDEEGLYIQTGDYLLEIIELQLPGSKRMQASQFMRGHSIPVGTVL